MPEIITAVIGYDRIANLKYWDEAWRRMKTRNAKLVFIVTGNIDLHSYHEVIKMPNTGMDIGALQRFIQTREDYDRLLWCTDDSLPLIPDLLDYYQDGDLVGTFWSGKGRPEVPDVEDHLKTTGICMTKEVCKRIKFPPGLLEIDDVDESRKLCLSFEHGDYNLYQQVKRMGKSIKMADGTIPPNCLQWGQYEFLCDVGNYDCGDRLTWIHKYPGYEFVPML